jgi:hypothetical protein
MTRKAVIPSPRRPSGKGAPHSSSHREHGHRRAEVRVAVARRERGVHGGAAAALGVAVHPVVVDEQVRLQHLERRADVDGGREVVRGVVALHRAVGRDDHGRAQALAPAHRQLAYGIHQHSGVVAEAGGRGVLR